jgi:hypothetical protein
MQMPHGGAGEWAEFVLDYYNWARHALPEPKPVALPRPKSGAGADGGGADSQQMQQMQMQMQMQQEQLQRAHMQLQQMQGQLQQAQAQAQAAAAAAAAAAPLPSSHLAMPPSPIPQPSSPPPVRMQTSTSSAGSAGGWAAPPADSGLGGMPTGAPPMIGGGGGMASMGGGDMDAGGLKTPRDRNGLLAMLDNLTGGNVDHELPLAALQEVTKHVASVSRKAAPKLIQQKRAFVRGWHEEQIKLNSSAGSARRVGSGSPNGPAGTMPPMNISPDAIYAEVDARLSAAQRSITQSELAEFHVDALSEQISSLLQIPLPTMMRDRRALVLNWHAQQRKIRAQPGATGGGRR